MLEKPIHDVLNDLLGYLSLPDSKGTSLHVRLQDLATRRVTPVS